VKVKEKFIKKIKNIKKVEKWERRKMVKKEWL
jgi:hypothetical protein